jgi:transposase-like protein
MYLRPMRKTAQRPHPAGIGATIDFLLSAKRDAAAAEESLGRGRTIPHRGHQYRRSTPLIHPPSLNSKPAVFWKRREKSTHRPVQYLNNVLEQDHRAIKRRMRASQHFRSFLGVGE